MTQCIKLQILTTLFLFVFVATNSVSSQTVGVVLSGGGSSGLAHIGVLKALEDNQIPIDYITGTSMGAVIGGLYAAGNTLEEIESFFISQRFRSALEGEIDDKYAYFYQKSLDDATWVSLKTNRDTVIGKIIPANVLSPVQLDLELLEALTSASAISNYSFDSLFIPFRCVAADVQRKRQVIFDSGELHTAIRASSTYPFFFRPIFVDGTLLFDGGLYNNFPSDILYNEFSPDVIIGSNVSSNANKPDPDNLFSQLENMISSPTNFNLPCKEGIIISPKTESFTLDFSNPEKNIYTGYYSALNAIDSIKTMVKRRVSKEEVEVKRAVFLDQSPDFKVKSVTLNGEKKSSLKYFEDLMAMKDGQEHLTFEEWKAKYIKIFEDDKIAYLFPQLQYDTKDSGYHVNIRLHKEKELEMNFGGNISSRPVNMGFLGLKYNIFGKVPKTLTAKSHFGKFYGAVNLKFRFDFHKKRPFYIETEGLIQQWDYFKSFATFFEDSKPPFILQDDEFLGINIGTPVRNKGVLILDGKIGTNENSYYQIDNFSASDTADITTLDFVSTGLTYHRSTLNKKQFANAGTQLKISARLNIADEFTVPGSTGVLSEETSSSNDWLSVRLDYENYFKTIDKLTLGYSLSGGFSTIPIFSNYKSTILTAPSYQPIPESKTFFQEEFRAHEFGAVGVKFVYSPFKKLDIRLESYMFQPVKTILENEFKQAFYEDAFLRRYYIISTTTVYHSPLGPLSFAVNYYDKRDQNFSWILNFGYLLFNKRTLD